ncbi:hypothetical protein NP493_77g03038 [Ridgeia piscesae]|uniref:ATP-dependent RNA helicase n=1 Tax=Ridgeia piscesae TaxID=27915 RepID=A0AAD9P961_RIDPI|nr:hypothetical protein NP493_77g03038 [Ridgeia piscesae]
MTSADQLTRSEAYISGVDRQVINRAGCWPVGKQKQMKRTQTFFQFCNAKEGILLCTDVAARGLDIPQVDWIVQYDPPDDPKEYIHRVGRTARGEGGRGHALLILRPEELGFLRYLKQAKVPLNEFEFSWGKISNIQPQQLSDFLCYFSISTLASMYASGNVSLWAVIQESVTLRASLMFPRQSFLRHPLGLPHFFTFSSNQSSHSRGSRFDAFPLVRCCPDVFPASSVSHFLPQTRFFHGLQRVAFQDVFPASNVSHFLPQTRFFHGLQRVAFT